MAKILPQAIIDAKSGNSEKIILVRIIPDDSDEWDELLWATRDITVTAWEDGETSKVFVGGVLSEGGLGTIHQSVDIVDGGNISAVDNLTLKICNPQYSGESRFDEIFTYNLENRYAEIYIASWTGSNPAWSDILLLHRFVIFGIKYEYGDFEIQFQDARSKRHRDIPELVLTKKDYPSLPDYNEGKVAPLIFGDRGNVELKLNKMNVCPAIKCDKGKQKYIISCNSVVIDPDYVYPYFDGVGRLLKMYQGDSLWYDTPVPCIVSAGRPSTLEFAPAEYTKGILSSQGEQQGSKISPTDLDFKEAIDDDEDTYLTLTAGQKLYLRVPIPSEFARIQKIPYEMLALIVDAGAITGTVRLKYYNPEWDAGTGKFSNGSSFTFLNSNTPISDLFGNDKSAHGKADDQSDQYNDWTFDEMALYEFGVECDAGSSIQVKNIYIYLTGLLVFGNLVKAYPKDLKAPRRRNGGGSLPSKYETINFIETCDNLFVHAVASGFGSWIDESDRDNGHNEGNPMNLGAYPIESILRDELGLTSAEINYDSFDEVGNLTDGYRKNWNFASVVAQQKNSLELIRDFCRECGIIFFQNYEGKESVNVLERTSPVKIIDRTTLEDPSKEKSIWVNFSPLDKVYNEFYLNYDKQYTHGNFTKTLFITASDNNLSSNARSGAPNTYTGLCSDSQTQYGQVKRLTLDCDWIVDDDTAEYFIKWLAEWFCYLKCVVDFKSAGLDHLDLELGDQVLIDDTLLPAGINNEVNFMLYDILYNLDANQMQLKFIQVPPGLAGYYYDIAVSFNGKPAASEILLRLPFVRDVRFEKNMLGSRGIVAVAATAQVDLLVKKNGTQFGTIRFPASSTTAEFLTDETETFSAGDVLTVEAPPISDLTLSGLGFLLKGYKI